MLLCRLLWLEMQIFVTINVILRLQQQISRLGTLNAISRLVIEPTLILGRKLHLVIRLRHLLFQLLLPQHLVPLIGLLYVHLDLLLKQPQFVLVLPFELLVLLPQLRTHLVLPLGVDPVVGVLPGMHPLALLLIDLLVVFLGEAHVALIRDQKRLWLSGRLHFFLDYTLPLEQFLSEV